MNYLSLEIFIPWNFRYIIIIIIITIIITIIIIVIIAILAFIFVFEEWLFLSTLCSFGHILEIFQAAVFAIFFIVDDVLNRVCTYLYDLSSQKASLIQFQYIFTYRHQVALLISRSCHSVFLRPTEFFLI